MIVVGAATAAAEAGIVQVLDDPPHDCRWRGDCGSNDMARKARLNSRLMIVVGAATAAYQSWYLQNGGGTRLMIVVGAATAARYFHLLDDHSRPAS